MPITIRQTVEVSADLNSYYPQFTHALRKQIDAEVIKLASGERRTAPARRETFPASRHGYSRQTPDDTVVWITTMRCRKHSGPVACVIAAIRFAARTTQAEIGEIMAGDLRDTVAKELTKLGRDAGAINVNTYVRNLFKDGYLTLEKPV